MRLGGRRPLLLLAVVAAAAAGVATHASAEPPLGRLVPPADGTSHFGFTFPLFDSADPVRGDSRSFDERIQDAIANELAGKTPTFLTVWAPWQYPDRPGKPLVPFASALGDVSRVRAVVGEQGVIYLDWNITQTTFTNGGITTPEVAAGKYDGYIRRYAREARDYGRPLLVRLFNGEFNGSWWLGVSPKADMRVTTGDFVRAWRRVVDIFRAVGASNVSWAWIPNAYPADPGQLPGVDHDIAAYWPGDDYVDWAGADFYDVGPVSWLDGPYAFAVAHGKPFFVAEFGIRHEWSGVPPGHWAPWLAGAFDYFESHPAIMAICYFDYDNRGAATHVRWDPSRDVFLDAGRVRYTPNLNDHDHRLLAAGPDVQALFSERIGSPRYVSVVRTEAVSSTPERARVTLLAPAVRRGAVVVRWSGNLAADTFDVALRGRGGGWRLVAAHVAQRSYRAGPAARKRVFARVRARDVDGRVSAWTTPVPLPTPR